MNLNSIDTTTWERSSNENWFSSSSNSLQMLQNLSHDYIVSDVSFANYTLSSKVSVLQSDDDGVGVVFDYIDALNYKYIMYQGGGLSSGWGGDFGVNPTTGKTNAIALFYVLDGEHIRVQQNEDIPYWSINSTFEVKLENIFDDVFFYVNDVEYLRYKKEDSVSGKIGFVTFSQIANFNEIKISKALTNRAKAKYVLYAVGNSDVYTEIEVAVNATSDIGTTIIPRVIEESYIDTEIFAIYRGNSDTLVEIQPIGYNNIPLEIEVRPHNKMQAIYEVQQPPIITTVVNPFQDSFTREKLEYQTINYGSSSSMVAGRDNTDIWRSFVQFELSFINPSYILTESHLRLYYKGIAPNHVKLEVLNASEEWTEDNITHSNRPTPIKLITDEFTVNSERGYIEFDVLSVVQRWVSLLDENNGFIIRVSNESELGQTTFYTRETMFPPELVVKHYDSRIFSNGRSQVNTEIFVWKSDTSDINTEVEVTSAFDHSIVLCEIYCHQVDVPLDNDVLVEIIASIPCNEIEIISAIRKNNDILVEIGSRLPNENKVLSQITVSRDETQSEIFVKYTDIVESEIYARALGNSDVFSEVTSSRESILSEVTCARNEFSDTLTEILINVPYVNAEIYVKHKDDIDVEINIVNDYRISVIPTEILVSKDSVATEIIARISTKSEIYTMITASRIFTETEIEVRYRSDIWVEIEPNIKSDVLTEILASKPCVYAEIEVERDGLSGVHAEIFVLHHNDMETEIDIKIVSQVDTEIDIKAVSQTDAEIISTKPYVFSSIVIPTWVNLDIPTTIEPRIFMVNNIYTIIRVGNFGGAYAFII